MGSGQNALLTYFMIPFIKILGLTTFAIRLPMAIISCISLMVLYLILKKIGNKKIAIIGLLFFTICPWHIMKSRWALESNLFPDIMLLAVFFMTKGLMDKKIGWFYGSMAVAGITAYAYGTSYFFLPLFIIPLLGILLHKKQITIKQAIISLGIVGIITLPMILFVIINTFDLNQINLPFMTIPRLATNRYEKLTSIFSSDFLHTSIKNFTQSIGILVTQQDWLPWNSIKGIGTMYLFSTIFTVIGLISAFRKEKQQEPQEKRNCQTIWKIWFIVGILLTFICEPNINRLNILMIPIVYYTVMGIVKVIEKYKKVAVITFVLYMISFFFFMQAYIKQDYNNNGTFESNVEEVVQYAVTNLKEKEVYVTKEMQSPYMYFLFYEKYPTEQFINTREQEMGQYGFIDVYSFGNYHFGEIEQIENSKNKAYIIRKTETEEYPINKEDYKITELTDFLIVEGEK